MAVVCWSKDKQEYHELLVNGYIRMIEREYSLENSINDAFEIILSYILPLILLGFDLFQPRKFKVSDDKLSIIGNHDDKSGTFLIYAICDKETGYDKRIHFWSVACIKGHHKAFVATAQFGGATIGSTKESESMLIGIKNERKKLWIHERWLDPHEGGLFYYLNGDIATKYWTSSNNIITVKLDCDNWTITYFHGTQLIQKNDIKANESYFFVLQMYCYTGTHFRVVPTPNKLII